MRALIAMVASLAVTSTALGQLADENYCAGSDGTEDERIAACTRAIASGQLSNKGLADGFNNRGKAWYYKGDYDRAIVDFTEAIRLNARDAEAYLIRGLAWLNKNEYDRAIADWSEVIRLSPRYAQEAYMDRGGAWLAKGDSDRAIADFTEAIRLAPKDADPYFDRGRVWSSKGEYDRAIADFNEVIRLDPTFPLSYIERGIAWSAKGDKDRATTDYNEAIRLDSKNAKTFNELAWLLATSRNDKVRDGRRAIELATHACDMTNWKFPKYIETLAAAYAEVGQLSEAIRWQEKAIENPEIAKSGVKARARLELYRAGKPYRE